MLALLVFRNPRFLCTQQSVTLKLDALHALHDMSFQCLQTSSQTRRHPCLLQPWQQRATSLQPTAPSLTARQRLWTKQALPRHVCLSLTLLTVCLVIPESHPMFCSSCSYASFMPLPTGDGQACTSPASKSYSQQPPQHCIAANISLLLSSNSTKYMLHSAL